MFAQTCTIDGVIKGVINSDCLLAFCKRNKQRFYQEHSYAKLEIHN